MRKLVGLFLAVLFCSQMSSAMAEGQRSITQKNLYVFDGSLNDAHLFARVENTGDEPINLDAGQLVIFDKEDNIVDTSSYIRAYPTYLRPGEYAYAEDWSFIDAKSDDIGDYKFSISTTKISEETTYFECEASYDAGDFNSEYDDYIYVTFTNTTDQTVYGIYVVAAVLDEEGNILYVSEDCASSLGVHSGSSITKRISVDSDFAEYFQRKNIKPKTVDALVYIENRK